jgi:hypothetical protein
MISGEMGRSNWKFPEEYAKLVSKYRGTLARGKQGAPVKVGIALNWNKACGNCFIVPGGTAEQYNSSYGQVRVLLLCTAESALAHCQCCVCHVCTLHSLGALTLASSLRRAMQALAQCCDSATVP